MGWTWRKEHLDLILVPIGLVLMFCYHFYLLYRYLNNPKTTLIGYENHNKRVWVERMMKVEAKERGLAISVINNNISAATSMSSISLVLSSLMGAWIGGSSEAISKSSLIYGDTRPTTISIKYISILSFFLVAFASFVQTTRSFVNASFLISMPNCVVPESYVEKAVIRGSNFWSFGIRALYFATTLLLWIFGPIPMFVCSVVMVGVLHNLDKNSIPLDLMRPYLSDNININKKIDQELADVTTRPQPQVYNNFMLKHIF